MPARQLELILTAAGGAELVDIDAQQTLWSSDSDPEFREEFPDLLDENDAEAVFEWLLEDDQLTEDEYDDAELSMETLEPVAGPPQPIEGELLDPDDDDGDFEDDDGG